MYVNVNFKASKVIADELEGFVKRGYFKDESEAMNEAVRLLVKFYSARKAGETMDKYAIKLGRGKVNLTKSIEDAHESEENT
jgi:Arc/MetJ-type ribon-helix-helix transcriptional regulator